MLLLIMLMLSVRIMYLAKRGTYFGAGSAEDRELAHRLYGIVNVGPPLKL